MKPKKVIGKLKVECAWCGKYMGTKESKTGNGITHSICGKCREKYFPKYVK